MKKRAIKYISIVFVVLVLIVVANICIRNQKIKSVRYTMHYPTEDHILNQAVVSDSLKAHFGSFLSQSRKDIELDSVRHYLETIPYVSRADLAISMRGVLSMHIYETLPIVHVFSANSTYYLDSLASPLPAINSLPSHTLIATGDLPSLSKISSSKSQKLIKSLVTLSSLILNDSILKYQISQIHYSNKKFVLIPQIGDYTILIGPSSQWAEQLNRLHHLYTSAFFRDGWNNYSQISLLYSNQAVCTRKTNQ